MEKRCLIKRNDLYNQVWSTPMTLLAKEYGISDVGLAKICKKLNIPKPFSGYWRLKETGKHVEIPRLPLLKDGEPDSYELVIDEEHYAEQNKIRKRIEESNHPQIIKRLKITVKNKLVEPDPIVQKTKYILIQQNYPDHLTKKRHNILDIVVTKKYLGRALNIFDAFIKALRSINQSVEIDQSDHFTYVVLNKQKIRIRLIEIRKQIIRHTNKLDQYSYTPHEYQYTGRLSLQVYDPYKYPKSKSLSINDMDDIPIEQNLKHFISKLFEVSIKGNIEDERQQERQKIYEEERRVLEEKRIKEQIDKENFQKLIEDANKWQQSQIIYSYIEAVNSYCNSLNISYENDNGIIDWITWAKEKADFLNPIKKEGIC